MTKEQIIEISQFLKDHILECELGTGCGKCDELRKHINILDSLALQPEQKENRKRLYVDPECPMISYEYCSHCNNDSCLHHPNNT